MEEDLPQSDNAQQDHEIQAHFKNRSLLINSHA